MTCEEFQKKFNLMIDGMLPDAEREDLSRHRQSCSPCAEYASGIEAVDRVLRDQPLLEIPDELMPKLIAIEEAETLPELSWRPYLLRWLAIGIAGTLTFGLPALLPGLENGSARALILTVGWTTIFMRRLTPTFISAGVCIKAALASKKPRLAMGR